MTDPRMLAACLEFVRTLEKAKLPKNKADPIWAAYVNIEKLLFEIGAIPGA